MSDSDFLSTIFSLIPENKGSSKTAEHRGKRSKHGSKGRISQAPDSDNNDNSPNEDNELREEIAVTNRDGITSVSQLHHTIQHKLQLMKDKRCKLSRDKILARRKDKKRKKKSDRKNSSKDGKIADKFMRTTKDKALTVPDKMSARQNNESGLMFSKFSFASEKRKQKPRVVTGLLGNDYKQILNTIQNKKQSLSNLKAQDSTAAYELEKRNSYTIAISKVQGLKVKDDEVLVKQALKRKEKKKQKSLKKWKHREETVAAQMREKQESRMKNIAERKQQNRDNKIKKARKRGRVSGF